MLMQTMETSLSNELLEGEELIWSGSPVERGKSMVSSTRRLQVVALIYAVLGLVLMLVAFIIEILIGDLQAGRESFILIPGFIILIIGVSLFILGKLNPFTPKSTFYAITNQRIIILCGGRYLRVISFDRQAIKQVQRFEYPDGSGNLIFSGIPGVYSNNAGSMSSQWSFRAIPNVRLAEQKLLSTLGQVGHGESFQAD